MQQVLTETASPGGGVRIILDLFPGKPYTYWKQSRPGAGGQTLFILGLKPDPKARPVQARVVPSPEPEPAPHGAAPGGIPGEGDGARASRTRGG